MKKTRIGIVGLGYWGPNLLRNFSQLDNCQVTYCCDLNSKKLNEIKKNYQSVKLAKEISDVLRSDEVDAVALANPSDTHAKLALAALRAGKHVLVEKPFTLSAKDAKKVIRAARKSKKTLMIGHTYEYNPAVRAIKKYLSKNHLGRLYYIYTTRVNLGKVRGETNALWNLAPHDVSSLLYFLEKLPIRVSAFGNSYLQKSREDVVFVNLEFQRKIMAHLHVSWLDPSKKREMIFVGSKRMLIYDDMDNEAPIKIYDKGVTKMRNSRHIYGEYQIKLRSGDIHMPYVERVEPLKQECKHFLECIQKRKRPISDGQSGLRVVQVLEAAEKSLKKKGKWEKIV